MPGPSFEAVDRTLKEQGVDPGAGNSERSWAACSGKSDARRRRRFAPPPRPANSAFGRGSAGTARPDAGTHTGPAGPQPPGGLDCGACSLYLRHRQRQVRTLRGELRLLRPVGPPPYERARLPSAGHGRPAAQGRSFGPKPGPCVSASSPRARPFRLPSWICCATAWNACAAPSPYVSAARWAC